MVLVLMAVEIKTIPIRNFVIASIYNHHTDVVGSHFTIDTKLINVNIVRYVLKKLILVYFGFDEALWERNSLKLSKTRGFKTEQ